MGKVTGFLEYERKNNGDIPVKERVLNFKEFHTPLSEKERREQAARCMNCGVPLCQSAMKLSGMVTGCPLHNLIPEWNDQIWLGHDEHAFHRLLKTSNFPEFTGRVCPALCEKACMNGQYGEPVSVHDNELFLIEKAFEKGYIKPRIPKVRSGKKVAVVGSGPSGLAVADELNHRGHLVTVYEREPEIGGLLMFGIPNMKLDKSVILRRKRLMEEEGVTFLTGVNVGVEAECGAKAGCDAGAGCGAKAGCDAGAGCGAKAGCDAGARRGAEAGCDAGTGRDAGAGRGVGASNDGKNDAKAGRDAGARCDAGARHDVEAMIGAKKGFGAMEKGSADAAQGVMSDCAAVAVSGATARHDTAMEKGTDAELDEKVASRAAVMCDVTAEELKTQYDAVVLCCGAKQPRSLAGADMEQTKGIYYAVDFLTDVTKSLLRANSDAIPATEAFKLPPKYGTVKGKHVVVVGGGDTGNDCIGTVIRLGAKSVTALEMMPQPPEERAASNPWPEWPKVKKTDYGHEEAIELYGSDPRVYETTVKEFITDKSHKLKKIKTVQVKFQNGKLTEVEGSEKELPCDLLLIAAGFVGCEPYTAEAFGVKRTNRGTVETAADQYATSVEGVFTAGDMHRGQSLVVWAVCEGRSCAREVDEYLMGYTVR